MGNQFTRLYLTDLADKLRGVAVSIPEATRAGMSAIVSEGALEMQQTILAAETATGVARVASGQGPYAGRYDTGTMYNDVDFETRGLAATGVSDAVVQADFGWLHEYLDYFGFQENGTSRGLVGMFALKDATMHAKDKFVALGPAMIRAAKKELGF